MPTPRQSALGFITEAGADLEDQSGRTDFHISLTLPPGKVWICSDTHGLSYHYFSDRPAAWRHVLSDVKQGARPCDIPECETCNE